MKDSLKIGIRSRLSTIDKLLCRMEDAISGNDKVLMGYKNDLTKAQKESLVCFIAAMREKVGAAAERIRLAPEKQSALREIDVSLDFIWLSLEEMMPERLKGYGVMEEGEARLLRGTVDSLMEELNEVMKAVPRREKDGENI